MCQDLDVVLFADDTNLTAKDCAQDEIMLDLARVNSWLINNKSILNAKKSFQLDLDPSASRQSCNVALSSFNVAPLCKNLGWHIDYNSTFQTHIRYVKDKISEQCGIVTKLRHYVPRRKLTEYYKSNIKSILQYGFLVYGCCILSSLTPLLLLQKKILKFIHFRRRSDHCNDLFLSHQLLTIHELHVYELLKVVLRSVTDQHSKDSLNTMFAFESATNTRQSSMQLIKQPFPRKRIERYSVRNRSIKLYNILRRANVNPENIQTRSVSQIRKFYPEVKVNFILDNQTLIKQVFEN